MMRDFLKHLRRMLISGLIRSAARPCHVLPEGRTLIIAPHPDDETFGCGGLIALKRAHHAPVDLLFLSSGEASHNDCCRMDQAKVAEARRSQAQAAAELLGITGDHLHWLDMRDGSIPGECGLEFDSAVDQIAEVIKRDQPAAIYCPHPLDSWPDHEATARIVLQAAQTAGFKFQVSGDRTQGSPNQVSGFRSKVFFYLVWGWYGMPLRRICRVAGWQGGRVKERKALPTGESRIGRLRPVKLDIRNVLDKKLAAIREYAGKHPKNCPHPYIGGLPDGFLEPFQKPYEIFFEAV